MYIPTTKNELDHLGWDKLDIILVTGDSYIDSPYIGTTVIGKVLLDAGFKVGIIAQPDIESGKDICRLGEPTLFWGVSAGCLDSMVANRTATGRKRKKDDYTPGGENNLRPDRASIVYSNLIRKNFKNTSPIILGGIEASLRRIAHYDFWTDKIRKSILIDAKADFLLYGMADQSVVELATAIKENVNPNKIRGLCYISRNKPEDIAELPSFKEVTNDKSIFTKMFHTFYNNTDPVTAIALCQQQDTRYVVQNPPARYLSTAELDHIHDLNYERNVHPYYLRGGAVKALETIRFSITTHRGCYGECSFCAISMHQGRTVRWRSKKSIINEAKQMTKHRMFKGIINDVGGPTANMYGFECARKATKGCCTDKRCIYPEVCAGLKTTHTPQTQLLKELRQIPDIKKIFVTSGIRHDMVIADKNNGYEYLKQIVCHHVSGQMKLAPEHSETNVLNMMGKPGKESLIEFRKLFYKLSEDIGKKQFLTYYMIAAHPGCTQEDMLKLKRFASRELKLLPEQIQVFTPTPSTYSTLMYYTEQDPFSGKPCFVEKSVKGREKQKNCIRNPNFR